MNIVIVYLNQDKYVNRGVGYIYTMVKSEDHSVCFLDSAYTPTSKIISQIISGDYDILLISASTVFYGQAITLAQNIKRSTNAIILLGGLHVTIIQEQALKDCPEIDYICIGEGEEFIVEFLRSMSEGNQITTIPNLGYRDKNGDPTINKIRPCTS